jgi:hypothetical protein
VHLRFGHKTLESFSISEVTFADKMIGSLRRSETLLASSSCEIDPIRFQRDRVPVRSVPQREVRAEVATHHTIRFYAVGYSYPPVTLARGTRGARRPSKRRVAVRGRPATRRRPAPRPSASFISGFRRPARARRLPGRSHGIRILLLHEPFGAQHAKIRSIPAPAEIQAKPANGFVKGFLRNVSFPILAWREK